MTLFKLSYCKSLFYILITILLFSKCTWDNEEEKLTKGGNNNTTDTTLFSKSLIAFFTFEESFTDSSKNELLLKTEGNPTFAKTGYSSTSNSSLYLDGQSSIKLFIGTYDTLTLCMWIKSFSQLNNINNNESPTIINYSNGKFNLSIDGITGQTHPVIKTQNKNYT
mgnify:FL=1